MKPHAFSKADRRARIAIAVTTLFSVLCFADHASAAPKDAAISGSITDKTTSKPLSGVEVSAFGDDWKFYTPPGQEPPQARAETRTDASGAYRIEGLVPGRYYVKYEGAPGYPQRTIYNGAWVRLDKGQALEGVDFTPTPGLAIRGNVSDPDGNPIAGALVHALSLREEVTTDAFGNFALYGGKPGDLTRLFIDAEGWEVYRGESWRVFEDDNTVSITLRPAGVIAGTVVKEDGSPWSQAYLGAYIAGESNKFTETTANDDGAFELKGLPANTYKVLPYAAKTDGESHSLKLVREIGPIELGERERIEGITLVCERYDPEAPPVLGTLSGRVRNSAGVGIPDAHVSSFGDVSYGDATTNAEGKFSLQLRGMHRERETHLNVSHVDYMTARVKTPPLGTTNMGVVLHKTYTVVGHVVSAATGAPVPSFKVSCLGGIIPDAYVANMMAEDGGIIYYDPHGRFDAQPSHDGPCGILVRAPGFAPGYRKVDPAPDDGQTRVRIALEPDCALKGIVRAPDGKPLSRAAIYLTPESIESTRWALGNPAPVRQWTSVDGAFAFEQLQAGPLVVSASHEDYLHAEQTVDLSPDHPAEAELVLASPGTLCGRVTLNGVPVAGEHISLQVLHGGPVTTGKETFTDDSGNYEFTHLYPGEVMARVDWKERPPGLDIDQKRTTIAYGQISAIDFDY